MALGTRLSSDKGAAIERAETASSGDAAKTAPNGSVEHGVDEDIKRTPQQPEQQEEQQEQQHKPERKPTRAPPDPRRWNYLLLVLISTLGKHPPRDSLLVPRESRTREGEIRTPHDVYTATRTCYVAFRRKVMCD